MDQIGNTDPFAVVFVRGKLWQVDGFGSTDRKDIEFPFINVLVPFDSLDQKTKQESILGYTVRIIIHQSNLHLLFYHFKFHFICFLIHWMLERNPRHAESRLANPFRHQLLFRDGSRGIGFSFIHLLLRTLHMQVIN